MEQKRLEELVDQLNRGTISESDRSDLFEYYNAYQFTNKWDEQLMGNYDEVGKRIYEQIGKYKSMEHVIRPVVPMRWLRLAAACMLIVAMGWGAYTFLNSLGGEAMYSASQNAKVVILPDGTKVTMNVNSVLRYPKAFDDDRRNIEFEGEGYFEVMADKHRPFVITTDVLKIKVLGTEFNLRAYREDPTVETSLIAGKVVVLSKDETKVLSELQPKHKFIVEKETRTSELSIEKFGLDVETVPIKYLEGTNNSPVDVAWKEGLFAFHSSSLGEISRTMQRKYGVKIRFEDPLVAQYKYTARFDEESVTEILDALSLVKRFEYRKEDNGIVIY